MRRRNSINLRTEVQDGLESGSASEPGGDWLELPIGGENAILRIVAQVHGIKVRVQRLPATKPVNMGFRRNLVDRRVCRRCRPVQENKGWSPG